jgi:hypothetical protein
LLNISSIMSSLLRWSFTLVLRTMKSPGSLSCGALSIGCSVILTLYFDHGDTMSLFGCILYGRGIVVWMVKAINAFVLLVSSSEHDIWLLSSKGKCSSSGSIPSMSSSQHALICNQQNDMHCHSEMYFSYNLISSVFIKVEASRIRRVAKRNECFYFN